MATGLFDNTQNENYWQSLLQNRQPANQTSGNVLSSLTQPQQGAYNNTLTGMLTGTAYSSQDGAAQEAFARAAQNMKAQTAQNAFGAVGQGAARRMREQ